MAAIALLEKDDMPKDLRDLYKSIIKLCDGKPTDNAVSAMQMALQDLLLCGSETHDDYKVGVAIVMQVFDANGREFFEVNS